MPAVTASGWLRDTVCQPDAVSFVADAVASRTPELDQIETVCAPVFVAAL